MCYNNNGIVDNKPDVLTATMENYRSRYYIWIIYPWRKYSTSYARL